MDTQYTFQEPQGVAEIPSSKKKLEKISFIVLLVTLLLTPLAFIPTSYAPLDMAKTVIISIGILVSVILYGIVLLDRKAISIPKHPLVAISCGIVVSLLISSLLSTNIGKSIFGQGFESGTASFIAILFIGLFLTFSLTHKEKDRILYMYGTIILSYLIIVLFHVVRFFNGPDTLTFGIFNSATSTFLGSWNDLAFYSGVVALLSYIALQFIPLKKIFKILLILLLAVSGLFLFIINSPATWFLCALMLLGILVYQYFIAYKEDEGMARGIMAIVKSISVPTLILLLVACAGFWKGDKLSDPLAKSLKIDQTEFTLPWQPTLDVVSQTIKESPFFGAGPNRFSVQYLKFKPQGANSSIYWNAEFNNGSGLIQTFIVTQGLVGFLLWLIFIILFAYAGIRVLKKTSNNLSRFFVGSTFFSSLFLWIACFVYVPSHSILLLTFILTGLFVASLVNEEHLALLSIGRSEGSSMKRIIPIFVIALIILAIVWAALYLRKTIAVGYFQGGLSALAIANNQGIDRAENDFKKALTFGKSDIYYQALSEVNIMRITALAQQLQTQKNPQTSDAATVKKVNDLIDGAVQYTRMAVAIDPTNYYNYVSEARISEVALSLQVPNAYENVKAAYTNALTYNPYNPALYLNLARIEATQNKLTEAEKYVGAALQLKQNYTEAIFLLSQIQVSRGQIKEAITSVQVASQINPTNPLVFFQLGLLYYNDKNYQEAVTALVKAVQLDNQYANAQYFLGLSYARLGRTAEAIVQFENLSKTNPDSQEVTLILSNLRAGRSAFTDAQPPIDNKPEQRKSLPVKEKPAATKK